MSKKNLIYFGIFAFLVLVALLAIDPNKSKNNILSGLENDKVNKIEIVKGEQRVVLEKSGTDWKIADTKDFYVSAHLKNELNNLFVGIKNAKIDLVSENDIKKLELINETGILAKFYNEENIIKEVQIGKIGSDYPSTYISMPNSDISYLINKDLFSLFGTSQWHDKTILALDADLINKIRIQHGNQEFKLELNEDDEWQVVAPSQFEAKEEEKIMDMLELIDYLEAVEIPEQNFAGTGLEKNNLILQFSGEGIDQTLMVGDKKPDSNKYYIKRGDSDNIYLITEDQKNILDIKISDLR
jgi:hypothetical protein